MSLYRRVVFLLIFSVILSVFITVYVQEKTITELHAVYNPPESRTALVKMRDYIKKNYSLEPGRAESINEVKELSHMIDNSILIAEEFDILKDELKFRIIIGSVVPPFIFMLIFLAAGRYILKNLFSPIRVLTRSMKLYSRGDNSVFPMPVSGIAESKMLLSATNAMMETISNQKEIISMQGRSLGWKNSAREIVHEIKNILTPARLAAESSVEGVMNNDCGSVKTDIKKILLSLDNLEKMAGSLGELSNMREPVPEKVDLYEIAEQAAGLYSAQFNNIRIAGEHLEVLCDRELMRSVLHHLIVNAIDSVSDKSDGEILIRVDKKEKVFLECSDNGYGIDPAIRDKVFKPDFTTKENGTGFGLYFVKRILDDHGYSIEVDEGLRGAGVTMRMVF